jgi:hypothetical protein
MERPMRKPIWRPLLLAGLLLELSCITPHAVSLYGSEGAPHPADYMDVLESWTRSAKIYRHLDNKLFVTATYHSPELRRSFAVAFPDIYGHGGKITRRELVDLSGGVEQFHTFFLAVHTPDSRWNDLAKNDSIWHCSLAGSSESTVSVSAQEIIPVKIDENLRAVYPYIGRFDKIYLVRFPLTDPLHRVVIDTTTQRFVVRIASALGSAELPWVLSAPPSAN